MRILLAFVVLAFTSLRVAAEVEVNVQRTAVEVVRVAVASNFLSTAKLLAQDFESSFPYRLQISAASSGKLYAQILQGAPYDLFLSADVERPQRLFAQGVGVASPQTYALGQLVLWQPSAKQPPDSNSLATPEDVRVAFANPRVAPYGKAAQEVVQGLKGKVGQNLRIVRGENIAQALHFVRSANVDMGFVALSQVKALGIPAQQWWLIPADVYSAIEQQALLLQDSDGAQAVWQYLQSPQAKAIIQQSGYALDSSLSSISPTP